MLVTIINKAHFKIQIDGIVFLPFEIKKLNVYSTSEFYKKIRCNKNLVDEAIFDTNHFKKTFGIDKLGKEFNFVYDENSQHKRDNYKFAIQAMANPILKYFSPKEAGFSMRPLPGKSYNALNIRFFNSTRIKQNGKTQVGERDIFYSHGCADKQYWVGKRIKDFKYAFCIGKVWEDRMRSTGYKGEIIHIGYPKLDPIWNGEVEQNKIEANGKPYISWLPTHGYSHKNRGRSSYPWCLDLIRDIDDIYYKKLGMHPTSKKHNGIKHKPTFQELVDSDVVIADAGSTVYESWMLGKPVIFPDWICKKSILNHFKDDPNNLEYKIYKNSIGYHAKDMKDLNRLIEKALINGIDKNAKEFINEICPVEYRGNSGKMAYNALKQIY
jgi:hypothetical protein